MALFGWTWYQDDEPTVGVLPTQEWIQPTSGEINRRNLTNTAWVFFGNVADRMGGAAEVAGSTMTGPLLDTPNLPPLENPDFIGTIQQGGFNVALLKNLAELERRLYDRVTFQVREQFLSQFQKSGTSANIAFYSKVKTDTWNHMLTGAAGPGSDTPTARNASVSAGHDFQGMLVDLPVFSSDGITATDDQTIAHGAIPLTTTFHVPSSGADVDQQYFSMSDEPRLWGVYSNSDRESSAFGVSMLTWAFAVR